MSRRNISVCGRVIIFTGPMRCRKTLDVIIAAREAECAGQKVVAFFPVGSGRWGVQGSIASRLPTGGVDEKIVYPAYAMKRDLEGINDYLPHDTDVVIFDDVQFFDHNIIGIIERLRESGVDVYAAGLDMDCFKQPFGPMPYIFAIADKIRKRTTVCHDCSAPAQLSYRLTEDEAQEVIGDDDYITLCHDCHRARMEEMHTPPEMRGCSD